MGFSGARLLAGLFLILCTCTTGIAQRRLQKSFLDSHIKSVVISGEQCFQILIGTSPTQEVVVQADMEGEYQNDVFIEMETIGNTVRIGTNFAPNFERPNDKLSAHKVLSIRLNVLLPEMLNVSLSAADCQVIATGNYKALNVMLAGGGCVLHHLAEMTSVSTVSAFIEAQVNSGQITAHSGFGEVSMAKMPFGNAIYNLSSVRGNIRVKPRQ